jgi:zinc transport system substrate-binding protein
MFFLTLTAFAGGNQEAARTGSGETEPEGPVKVFVSILPQRYFVEQIGGELVDVDVLVKPGQSPHSYEPSPSQIVALGKADILFTIGVDFEKAFLPEIRSALSDLTIVETQHGIDFREMEAHTHEDEHDHEGNEHDEEGEHHDEDGHDHDEDENGHEGNDPHVWLSLENGKIIGENVMTALVSADPANKQVYESSYQDLVRRIDAVKEDLKAVMSPLRGEKILVFHPAFGYFTEEFGLVQEAIETGGKEPSPKQLEKIISEAKAERVRVIFVQPQFSRSGAEKVAEAIDGAVVAIDPLAPDWLSNMRRVADTVREGLID